MKLALCIYSCSLRGWALNERDATKQSNFIGPLWCTQSLILFLFFLSSASCLYLFNGQWPLLLAPGGKGDNSHRAVSLWSGLGQITHEAEMMFFFFVDSRIGCFCKFYGLRRNWHSLFFLFFRFCCSAADGRCASAGVLVFYFSLLWCAQRCLCTGQKKPFIFFGPLERRPRTYIASAISRNSCRMQE